MPRPRAPHSCDKGGCTATAPAGQPRCDRHTERTHDDRRPSAAARGYDRQWRQIRADYLRRHGHACECSGCDACLHTERLVGCDRVDPSPHVDHRHGLGPGVDDRDIALQVLCPPCHSSKTARVDGGFGNPRRPRTGAAR